MVGQAVFRCEDVEKMAIKSQCAILSAKPHKSFQVLSETMDGGTTQSIFINMISEAQ